MLNKLKKGFSLVEVMILFAVLAVALAASVPMLTKKTKVVPRPTTHGVYICYPTENGVVQEYYNSSNPLGSSPISNPSPETRAKCEFKVPKANKFKVELYSAGAGGVEFADIQSRDNGRKSADLGKTQLAIYAGGSSLRDIFGRTNVTYIPTNNEFATLFDGLTATLFNYTGQGGSGGKAEVSYTTPYNGHCSLYDSTVAPEAYRGEGKSERYVVNTLVSKQFSDFCRYYDYNQYVNRHAMYPEQGSRYISATGAVSDANRWGTPVEHGTATFSQPGGDGGSKSISRTTYRGLPIFLDIYLKAANATANSTFYNGKESSLEKHKNKPYPFLMYLTDTINNSFNHGYYEIKCSGKDSSGNLTGCSNGRPSNANNGSDTVLTGYNDSKWQIKSNNAYKYALGATAGNDVTDWAGYRVPEFSGSYVDTSKSSNVYKTIQTQKAKGGDPGKIGIQVATADGFTIKTSADYPTTTMTGSVNANNPAQAYWPAADDCAARHMCVDDVFGADKNFAYYLFRGDDKPGSSTDVAQANGANNDSSLNAALGESIGVTNNYSIYTTAEGVEKTQSNVYPMARLYSKLYRKEYRLGNPGGAGKHAVYQVSQLGTNCTMNVPMGGAPLTYEQYKLDETERAKQIKALEDGLEVSITCKDSDNHVVLDKKLNGAKYDLSLTPQTYTWELGESDAAPFLGKPFDAKTTERPTITHSKPQWSRIFDKISTLDSKNVGYGGEGTSLKDSCNVPRGDYGLEAYIEGSKISGRGFDRNHDGKLDGYQCYPDIRYGFLYDIRDYDEIRSHAEVYTISQPKQGGPSAVVITW